MVVREGGGVSLIVKNAPNREAALDSALLFAQENGGTGEIDLQEVALSGRVAFVFAIDGKLASVGYDTGAI